MNKIKCNRMKIAARWPQFFMYTALIAGSFLWTQCNTLQKINPISNKWTGTYNVEIIVTETGITQAALDTRGFYRLTIDRAKEERTNIALRSQKRAWQGKLSEEKHLIQLERWELNSSAEKYQRARNLMQPKPNTFYIDVKPDKLTKVNIIVTRKGSKFEIQKSFYPPDPEIDSKNVSINNSMKNSIQDSTTQPNKISVAHSSGK